MDLYRTVRKEIQWCDNSGPVIYYYIQSYKIAIVRFCFCAHAGGNSQDWKWTGSTVISVSQREGQTLLCQAVDTSTAKHAFSRVRQICVQMIPLHSLTTKHRGSDKTHSLTTLQSCDCVFPQSSAVCVGPAAAICPSQIRLVRWRRCGRILFNVTSWGWRYFTKWLSAQILNFRWNHRKWCFSKTLLSSSNRGWSTFHRSVSSVKRYPKAASLLLFVNCYSGMLNVRAVSQLTSSLWVIQQEISPVRVILKALSFKALAIRTWVVW